MTNISNSMFESIRGALARTEEKSTGPANILRTEPGNTYTVRLLPFVSDASKTFFHYYQHGWNSFATGQYVSAISPQTFGERDPISEVRYKFYRGNDEEKAMAGKINRSEKWLVNAYVVNDPVNPDNNGKVMILRYGKQLHKVIASAIEGEDAAELGARIFDLSPGGCNLKIVVEKQGDYPTYVSSKFSFPSEIPGMDDTKAEAAMNNVYKLDEVFTVKGYDELVQMVNEHIIGSDAPVESSQPSVLPAATPTSPAIESVPTPAAPTAPAQPAGDSDAEIKDLLAGLDL